MMPKFAPNTSPLELLYDKAGIVHEYAKGGHHNKPPQVRPPTAEGLLHPGAMTVNMGGGRNKGVEAEKTVDLTGTGGASRAPFGVLGNEGWTGGRGVRRGNVGSDIMEAITGLEHLSEDTARSRGRALAEHEARKNKKYRKANRPEDTPFGSHQEDFPNNPAMQAVRAATRGNASMLQDSPTEAFGDDPAKWEYLLKKEGLGADQQDDFLTQHAMGRAASGTNMSTDSFRASPEEMMELSQSEGELDANNPHMDLNSQVLQQLEDPSSPLGKQFAARREEIMRDTMRSIEELKARAAEAGVPPDQLPEFSPEELEEHAREAFAQEYASQGHNYAGANPEEVQELWRLFEGAKGRSQKAEIASMIRNAGKNPSRYAPTNPKHLTDMRYQESNERARGGMISPQRMRDELYLSSGKDPLSKYR